jgi:starch-binding outer membrane protein, SusD/RagB family
MTPTTAHASAASVRAPHGALRRRLVRRATPLLLVAAAIGAVACADSTVPLLTAPTSVANNPQGLTQAMTGLFSYSRQDQSNITLDLSAFAREAANFTNTEPRFVTYDLGIIPIPVGGWITMWENEYLDIRQAQQILATIPQVVPAYTTQQRQALDGVVRTIEALNYLFVMWAHDTLGVAIMQSPSATALAPAVCLKDGLEYVVALLDSANAELDSAGGVALPFTVPPGFAAVGKLAGPSTVQGSFAAFNRALAAKAGLELAYAEARTPAGNAPTPTTPGAPTAAVLLRADSAAKASALYSVAALAPNPVGEWAYDPYSVLFDFSSTSGDLTNPMNAIVGTQAVLDEVPNDQDTVNDLRWKNKFMLNPNPVQQPTYNFVASKYIYSMYGSPSSPIPIIRDETLVLIDAQIQIGLGNYPQALALVNDVRSQVGGPAVKPDTGASYVGVRNALLREQQISTLLEGGADRVIALRMYNIEAQFDTTWEHTQYKPDQHTTVLPISEAEVAARGGSFTLTCN